MSPWQWSSRKKSLHRCQQCRRHQSPPGNEDLDVLFILLLLLLATFSSSYSSSLSTPSSSSASSLASFLLLLLLLRRQRRSLNRSPSSSHSLQPHGVWPLYPHRGLLNTVAARSWANRHYGGQGGLYLSEVDRIRSIGGGMASLYPIRILSLFNPEE